MLSDNCILDSSQDRLGFQRYARLLFDQIQTANDLPLAVGVFGPWGSGKTSLMKLLEGIALEADRSTIRTVWFNPWKYDMRDDVRHALIQSILSNVIDESSPSSLKAKSKRLAKAAAWLLARGSISTLSAGLLDSEGLDGLLDKMTEQDSINYRHINQFEADFAEVVEAYAGRQGKLIVFIDDLDRCTGESTMMVLESLKLFLGDSRCVFVVAMDYDTVSGIAAKKFGEGVHIRGQEYLEKIVQLPFFLPRVELSMLGSAYGPWVPEDVDPDLLWVLINAALGTNPRKAKRFLNSLAMSVRTLSLERRDSGNHHDGIWLAKLLIVQIEFPAFFRYLSRTPEAWSLLESGNSTERDGELAGFASDDRLIRFLEDTSARSYHPFPPAPTSNDLSRLMSIASTGLGGP